MMDPFLAKGMAARDAAFADWLNEHTGDGRMTVLEMGAPSPFDVFDLRHEGDITIARIERGDGTLEAVHTDGTWRGRKTVEAEIKVCKIALADAHQQVTELEAHIATLEAQS